MPAEDKAFTSFVLDQLSALEALRSIRMFGGVGLYCGETFFGIIHRGRLFFKTNDEIRRAYEDAGMGAFAPGGKVVLKRYFEVPPGVLERGPELLRWARVAVRASAE